MSDAMDDAQARRARAARLHAQIDQLIHGPSAPAGPKGAPSPREIIEKRMRELQKKSPKSR